ncbi:Cleavage and polyadenylation specificity factor subunit 2 [Lachancea thermotolerans]
MTYSFTCHSDPSGNHSCGVLRFENVTIMVDPAWEGRGSWSSEQIDFWGELVAQTDIILLSQPTAEFLGAYAMLYFKFLGHFKTRIAIFATLPVANLGRVTTLDLYASQGLVGPVQTNALDLNDIEEAFDHVITVKHSQILDLKSKYDGLTVIPYSSGYAPGGSIFCITTYSDKIIYAPRWNHTKDTILNSAAVLNSSGKPTPSMMRPSAVVTTTARIGSSVPYKKRAARFKELLREALPKNGTAIIPTDIGGKFLDLLVLVHDYLYEMKQNRNQSDVSVLLVSYSRGRTLTYARSMLEWLSPSIVKVWEGRNNRSPFDFGSRLKIVSPEELKRYSGSKICFVSRVDRLINAVVQTLCSSERTTVILTEPLVLQSEPSKVLAAMYSKWARANKAQDSRALNNRHVSYSENVAIQTAKTEPLKSQDLQEFESKIEIRRREHKDLLSKLETETAVVGDMSSSGGMLDVAEEEEDEDDIPDFITAVNRKSSRSVTKPIEIPVDIHIQSDAQPRHKMFPFHAMKVKKDDYGDVVDFTQFIPKDQLENSDKRNSSSALDEEDDPYELELASSKPTKKRRGGGATNSKSKEENFDDVSYLDSLNKPYRRILSSSVATLKCYVAAIDLSSLVDQRSLSVIWPSLKPHNVLLMPPQDSQNAAALKALSAKNLDVINMSFGSPAKFDTVIRSFDVSIDPDLDQHIKWQSVSDGYTIAHVVGRLVRDVTQVAENQQQRIKWALKPLSNNSKFHPKTSLAIGDVKLGELKRKLTHKNHVAEFKGEGSLVVDGKVVVRKISDGETVVDGNPSELFYEVKALVADMLAKL